MAEITVIIPNRTHAFPVNIKGTVTSNENSGTDIFAFVGSQKALPVDVITGPLQYTVEIESINMIAGDLSKDEENKKFVMANIDGSSVGIDNNLPTVSDLNSDNIASFKNIPLVRGQLQFVVNVSDEAGTIHSKTQTCTYTKARSLFTTDTIFLEVGTTLNASTDSVMDPEGIKQVLSFNWYRDGELIENETQSSYTITNDDVGREISADLKYLDGKNNQKNVVAIQNIFIVDSAPINFPVISGIPESGQTLTVDTSFIFDRNEIISDFSHVWILDGEPTAVTGTEYTLAAGEGDVGKTLKVETTYTDGAGVENTLSSPVLTVRDSAAGDSITVTGSPKVGQLLQASLTTSDGSTPTILSYEWRRGGKIIEGATTNSYRVKRADFNSFLTVTVEYDTGSGAVKYKTSGIINFQNSEVSGLPVLAKVLEDGTTEDIGTNTSVGTQLTVDVSNIIDPDDIKDFYYSFDSLTDNDLSRDTLSLNTRIGHNAIKIQRSSINQNFIGSSDQIAFDDSIEVQSVYLDNSLGNNGDQIFIQYKDSNNSWQNALEVTGKVNRFYLLDANISSSMWRLSFISNSEDADSSYYPFEAIWSLESPSILSTRKFIYQWQKEVNGVKENIIGARKNTYLVSQNDLNATINVKVTYVDGANNIISLESDTASVLNYGPTGKVSIEGTSKVGYILTAKPDIKDEDNITEENPNGTITTFDSYQWYLDNIAISGATAETLLLTSDMQTKRVSVEVFYTDSLNAQHSVKSKINKKVNAAPTGGVAIYGTPKVGKQLTIDTSNLKDLNQFEQLFYQWFLVEGSSESQIANAALQNYTVKLSDTGKSIRANVYYTDNDGFQEIISTNTVAILDSETTGDPVIEGVPVAGGTVTANIANISDENGIAGYAYQWRIDEKNIEGATFNSFTIEPDANGSYGNLLDVVVKVTDGAGNIKDRYSQQVRIALAAGTVGTDGGTVQGENVSLTLQPGSLQQDTVIYIYETSTGENPQLPEGSTLVGTAWAFTPHGTTFEQPITIEFDVPEGTNLVLRADDENDNTFEIVQNYTVANNKATLETNTFSVYVGSVFTPAVITGTPEQGNYLTASVSGDVADVTFQWRRNGQNILNAQNNIYLVKQEDVGQMITVAATFTDANGLSATKISAETEILNTPAEGQIIINGSRRVGITLESQIISVSDVNMAGEDYSYQWFRNSVQIDGATSANYEVVESDFLKDLSVKVSFTDGAGNTETITSEEVFISKKGSAFFTTNSRRQGDTLSVDTSTLNDFYSLFNRKFTWYHDGQPVANGETMRNRTLSLGDSGKNLKAVFTYTDGRGTNEVLETDERFIYTLSATITPAGGTVSDNGIVIDVPAGAVTQNTNILVYAVPYNEEQLPIGTLSDEVAYAFTPLDLSFNQPITITLPKPNDEYDMVLYGTNNSVDEFLMTEDDFLTINNTNQITIQTDNFGVFMSAILYVRVDILGTPEQGQVLDTLFTGEVFSYTYQWYRGETPIEGETGTTYTVTLQDVGEEIKVIGTYLLEENSAPETVESEPVLIVNSQPEVDTSTIIVGEDRVGEILTADPSGITDANNPGGLSGFLYQWKVEGQDIDGATNETLTIQPEHFNKNITVEITYVDATGLLESVTSDNLYITRIPPSGYVEVIGTPEVDEYLEVDTDNLVDLNGIGEFSYQWHADGVDLVGETNASLLVTSDMEDKAISVTLTYTDGVNEVETITSRNAPVIDADPVGNVVIDYTILEVAQTLVANTSAITDANSPGGVTGFTYQWNSNNSPISGATSKNYVVANQFCNTDITVTVTYTDGDGYIETLTSDAVTIVNSPVQGRPTVSGTPGVSETLTINTTGLISDVNVIGALNYKWFADGQEIAGATEKQWVVAANSYVGKTITGQVYYIDQAGNAEEVTTSNGLIILNSPPVGKPIVDGTFQVGQTLTVYTNEIEDFNVIATPFSFQWYVNNVAIADATGSTYVVQVDDINKNISVDASYTDEGNTLETVRSDAHLIVNTPGTATVLITNTGLEQGDILSSSVTSQDDNVRVSDYSYQWKRDGVDIVNANESTYMLGRLDWDKEITLQVSFTDTGGFVETFQSENSASMINSLPTGDIIITGSDKVGEVVEIDVSQIADANGIEKEKLILNSTIPDTEHQLKTIYFSPIEITKMHGYGVYHSRWPAEWARLREMYIRIQTPNGGSWRSIKDLDHSYVGDPLEGTVKIFETEFNHPIVVDAIRVRTYNRSGWDVRLYGHSKDTEEYTYQWYRDGQMLSGSTEKTYTTTFDDLYKTLTVDVSYTDYHGNIKVPNNTASFDIVNSPPEGTVLIAGTRNVGESLYFTHNVVDRDNITVDNPTGLVTFSSYQWYKSDSETGPLTVINGATGSTLPLTSDLQAKWIALDATYVDIEGDDDTIHASNRLPVKSPPTGNAIITSADLQLGRQVFLDTSTIADLNDLGEFSYQWYRTEGTGSIAISGAVQTHYSYQPADVGENIFCVVSYIDGDGDQEHVYSNNLGPVVQADTSVGTITIDSSSEINGEITSDVENIFAMNNFETVAPVVAYNFHSDTRDVSPNGLHLAGTNFAFDTDGGLDLSHSTSAYLRTSGTTPVLNNDTHTIAFRVKIKNTSSSWTKIISYGRSNHSDGSPEIWLEPNNTSINVDYDNVASTSIRTDTALSLDTWHDVILVKNGSTGRLYVDGNLIDENLTLPNPKWSGDYKLEFGYKSSTHPAAPVIIKDFQIFDFAVDDYTSISNYPFYTEPTLSYQWKADGNPIAGETNATLQLTGGNNDLGKDITLEVSLTDALGNARTVESNTSVVVGSELVEVERFLLEDGSEMLQEDGSSFLSETTTTDISLPLSINGQDITETSDIKNVSFLMLTKEENAGTATFKDYSLNNHSITRNSGQAFNSTTQSKFNGVSAYFDGSYDRLYTPHNSSLNIAGGDWTIEAWIYPDGNYSDYRTIISKRDGNYQEWQLYLRTGNGVLSFYNGTQYNSSVTPPANQWSHVAAVRNGTTVTLYLNGESIATWSGIDARNSNKALYVGSVYTGTECFKGYIDSVRVTKEALYTQNFDVPTEEFISPDTLVVGDIISVDVSNIVDPNGLANVEYQWYVDNSAIIGETSSSYTITTEEINKDIRVKAVFVSETGRKSARLSNEVTVVNTPAQGSLTITSSGTFEVGNLLIATPSVSDDNEIVSIDYDYQWFRDGEVVPNEIRNTYVLRNGDVGKNISAKITFIDKGYNIESITSDEVAILNSAGSGQVQILGQSSVGSILTADVSGVSDPNGILEFIYQWKRDGSPISGATSQSYTLTADDHNAIITVDVSYIDRASVVLDIDARDINSYNGAGNTIYDLSGYNNNGNINQSVYSAEDGGSILLDRTDSYIRVPTTIDYTKPYSIVQWVKPRVALTDSNSSSYRKTPLRGINNWNPGIWMTATFLRVHANTEYRDISIDWRNDTEWHQIGQIYDGATCYTIVDGQIFLGSRTAYSPGAPGDILIGAETTNTSYNWDGYVSSVTFYNKVLQQDEVENLFRSGQTYYQLSEITPTGTTNINVVTSNDSVYVDKASPTGTVTITGTREVLNTLTATNTLADQDGLGILSYQWYTGGNPIAGENSSTFDIPRSYVGQRIHVVVTYTDGNGDTETLVSEAVEISNPPLGSVSIEGTPKKGQTLRVDMYNLTDTNDLETSLIPLRVQDYSFELDTFVDTFANNGYVTAKLANGEVVNRESNNSTYSATGEGYLSFNGSNQLLTYSGNTSAFTLGTGNFSLEFWTKNQNQGAMIQPDKNWNSSGSDLWYIGINNNGPYLARHNVGGHVQFTNSSFVSAGTTEWVHVVIQKTDSGFKCFINGEEAGIIHESLPLNVYWNSDGFLFGGVSNYNYQPLTLALFAIYKRDLTAEEVLRNYKATSWRYRQKFDYQWSREISPGVYQNISGATNRRYVPTNSDVFKNLKVTVSYVDDQGFNNSTTSEPIYVENTLPNGSITFSGTLKTGNTITANIGNVGDANVIASLPTYQWKLNGIPVGGDEDNYTVVSGDVGKKLSLTISFVDSLGTIESVTTVAGVVQNSNPTNLLKWSNPSKTPVIGEGQALFNPSPNNSDYFGHSVAISGDGSTMVVGAHGDDSGGRSNNGAIYVYTKDDNGEWQYIQQHHVNHNDAQLGVHVDINHDGSVIVAGAFAYDYGTTNSGAVFVYVKNQNGTWTEQQRLNASDYERYAYFGRIVKISADGETIVVSAYADDVSYTDSGAAYIYTRTGTNTWGNQQKIYASRRGNYYKFSFGLAISGDGQTIAVGAHGQDYNHDHNGAVFMYTKNSNGTWGETQFILNNSRNTSDYFGHAVELSYDGDIMVVGCHGDDNRGTDSGAAYMYARTSSNSATWNYVQELVPQGNNGYDNFGVWVDMTGDANTIIVGAHVEDTTADNSGAVYLFRRNGLSNIWAFDQKLKSPVIQSNNYYGYGISVDNSGNNFVVGQYGYSSSKGIAFVYNLNNIDYVLDSNTPLALYNGAILSLDTSDITDNDTIVEESAKYRWYRLENNVYTLISENREYMIRDNDLGKTLKAEFEYLDQGGTIEVLNLTVNVPTDTLQLVGDLTVGTIVNMNSVQNIGKQYQYEWKINNKVVSTEQSYEIKPEDLGANLTAKATTIVDGEIQSILRKQGEVTFSREVTNAYPDQIYYDFTKYSGTNRHAEDLISGNNITWSQNSVSFSNSSGATFRHGHSDSLRTNVLGVLDNDYHTIALRIKINSNYNGSWYKIFSYGRGYGSESPGIFWHPNRNSICWKYNPSNTEFNVDIIPGKWHDVVGVKEGSILKIYLNGALVETGNVSNPKSSGYSYMYFGWDSAYNSAPMSIQKATIIPQALNQQQVQGVFDIFGETQISASKQISTTNSSGYFPYPPSGDYDNFGESGFDISGDGNTLVIGAYGADSSHTNTGAVYIYTRQGDGSWGNQKRITPPSNQNYQQWGWAVKLSADGTTLAVTAPWRDQRYPDTGYFSVYRKQNNGSWLNIYNFADNSYEAYKYMGYYFNQIDMSDNGNVIVVGNRGDGYTYYPYNAYYDGRFHIFEWNGSTYSVVEHQPTGQDHSYTSYSVSVSGDGQYIAVAAPYYDYSYTNAGYVWIYKRNSINSWGSIQGIVSPNRYTNTNFGLTMKMSRDGKILAISAPGTDGSRGKVYIYERRVNSATYNNSDKTIKFDGSNDYLQIDYNSTYMNFRYGQTIAMWIKPGSGANNARRNPYDQAYGGSGTITHETNGVLSYYFGTNGGNGSPYVSRNSPFTVGVNESAFVVVTRDQATNTVKWYKNGQLVGTSDANGWSQTGNSSNAIRIGTGYTNYFIGEINHVSTYTRAISEQEVAQLYQSIQDATLETSYSDTTLGNSLVFSLDSKVSTIYEGESWKDLSGNNLDAKFNPVSTYYHIQTLSDSSPANSDSFGHTLLTNTDGSKIVVGTPYDDENGTNTGKVTILNRRQGTNAWDIEEEIYDNYSTNLGEYRIRGDLSLNTILVNAKYAGATSAIMAIDKLYGEQSVENIDYSINVEAMQSSNNENSGKEYYIESNSRNLLPSKVFRLFGSNDAIEYLITQNNKISLPFIETIKEQLLYSKWYSYNQKLVGEGSSLDITEELLKLGKVENEIAYRNYKGEIVKEKSHFHFVKTNTDKLEQTLLQGTNLSLDIDSVIATEQDLSITNVELLGGFTLPSWLSFNSSTNVLSGVAPNNFVGNLSLNILCKKTSYKETLLEDKQFGIVIELKVRPNDGSAITNYKQYDWTGVEKPGIFSSTYSLNSSRKWSGKFQISSKFDPFWNEGSVFQEKFEDNWKQELQLDESVNGYNSFKYKSYYEEDLQFLQDKNMNTSPSWSGEWQIHNRFVPNFEQHSEKMFEEKFEDLSWSGYTRVDWTNIEDPKTVAAQVDLNGYTVVENLFQWASIPKPTFFGDNDYQEEFEDSSWTGFTRVDWYGTSEPTTVATTFNIQGYWEGRHNWSANPQPVFATDTTRFGEVFEDPTWSGFTRIDWDDIEEQEISNLTSTKGLSAFWEGRFKWSERAQPSFSEKSKAAEEDFDEDWTI